MHLRTIIIVVSALAAHATPLVRTAAGSAPSAIAVVAPEDNRDLGWWGSRFNPFSGIPAATLLPVTLEGRQHQAPTPRRGRVVRDVERIKTEPAVEETKAESAVSENPESAALGDTEAETASAVDDDGLPIEKRSVESLVSRIMTALWGHGRLCDDLYYSRCGSMDDEDERDGVVVGELRRR